MNKELAKTLTSALVNYIDENRPEGTMDCSSGECVSLEKAFTEENFDSVETLINKKLSRLMEFEQEVSDIVEYCKEHGENVAFDYAKRHAQTLLALAREQLIKDGYIIEKKAFHDAVEKVSPEVMKEVSDNMDKENELTKKYLEGYTHGYKDAEKQYDESVAYHFPTMPTTPVFGCDGIHCTNSQMDCINCPRKTTGGVFGTSSGTSTATLHGNTSATDGKEHNPSFTD